MDVLDICTMTPEGTHRGIGGFGYCTACGYRPERIGSVNDDISRRYPFEAGYSAQEVAAAREAVTENALRGIGYADAYRYALKAARIAFRVTR